MDEVTSFLEVFFGWFKTLFGKVWQVMEIEIFGIPLWVYDLAITLLFVVFDIIWKELEK